MRFFGSRQSIDVNSQYFKVTCKRSMIGLPYKSKNIFKSLGLLRTNTFCIVKQSPMIIGQLLKIKECILLENLTGQQVQDLKNAGRQKAPKGYLIIGNGANGGWSRPFRTSSA